MDFILNEKSLYGQFESVEEFLSSLRENIRCFELIHKSEDSKIYKITDFYKCKITKDQCIYDLKKHPSTDELMRFQMQLDQEIYTVPHWDEEEKQNLEETYIWNGIDVTATAIAEAAERNNPLLSFMAKDLIDCIIPVTNRTKEYLISSIYTPKFLCELYEKNLKLTQTDYLKIKYQETRIDCAYIEEKYGPSTLENIEYKMLLSTLDKFASHESWESIAVDDGLEYKKYHGSGKDDWFKGYNQTIMKFRFSDVMRVYGYRRGDRFRVLRFERDHKESDKG